MKSTVNQTHVRSINQRVILDAIFQVDTVSRAALSRSLNLSKVAITENLSFLLDLGIVKEVGTGQSQTLGGRRPILLQFNKEYKHIVAIDLVSEDAIFSLANLAGEIKNKFTIQVSNTSPFAVRVELMKNAISVLLSSQNINADDIAIIAISSPGIMNPHDERYQANEQFRNWRMDDLSLQLREHFTTEVMIVNDVNAAAIGEFNEGAGRTSHHILYISCGLGIGAGLILNNILYEGASKSAGEIANFIVDAESEHPVNLEKRTNMDSLIRRVRREAPEETLMKLDCPKSFTFKDIVRLWREGDDFIDTCLDDIAKNLAVAFSNMVSLLNVDLIILGGEYRVFSERMLPIINQIIEKTAFSPVPVVGSHLKCDASIHGLLTLARDKVFSQICNRNIKKAQ